MRGLVRSLLGLLVAALLIAEPALAQAPVQQVPTRLDAATNTSTANTTGAVITITPPGGNYVYVTGVDITNCAGASAVTGATPTTLSSTNLNGATWTIGSGATAGLCQPVPASLAALPLKSAAPGTNVTITLPAFATNQTVRVTAYYYFAP